MAWIDQEGSGRLGVGMSRSAEAKATERNRAKRRIKELWRQASPRCDAVIEILKAGSHEELEGAFFQILGDERPQGDQAS